MFGAEAVDVCADPMGCPAYASLHSPVWQRVFKQEIRKVAYHLHVFTGLTLVDSDHYIFLATGWHWVV